MKLKKNVKKILFTIIVLICITTLFVVGYKVLQTNRNPINSNNGNVTNNDDSDKIKTYTAKLIATGDGLIHSNVYKAAYDSTNDVYDFKNMLAFTKEKLKDYDIKYYNQETVFNEDAPLSNYPRFNTPPAFGEDMLDAGFNLISLATNHSMDQGANGAYNSALWWENKKDVLATGMFTSEEKRHEYQIKEANGITYTMLSYTYGTNGIPVPSDKSYLVNLFDEEKVLEDIKNVRDKVDVLIVAMHWGTEYKQDATETQKKQAKFLADNGVDIILGAHSHCIEPWEMIGNTPVFYSLCNFISGQNHADNTAFVRKVTSFGMFATMDIVKTIDPKTNTTTIEIKNIGADLNYNYKFYNQEKKKYDYIVIPFSKMEAKYLDDYKNLYQEFSDVLTKYDDSIKIEELPSVA